MICLPCGLAADLLSMARSVVDEREIGIYDDWLAPVAALVIHLHDRECVGRQRGGGSWMIPVRSVCDCQHRIGTTSIPGEPFIAAESADPVAAFMDACLADERLRPFDLLFVARAVTTKARVPVR